MSGNPTQYYSYIHIHTDRWRACPNRERAGWEGEVGEAGERGERWGGAGGWVGGWGREIISVKKKWDGSPPYCRRQKRRQMSSLLVVGLWLNWINSSPKQQRRPIPSLLSLSFFFYGVHLYTVSSYQTYLINKYLFREKMLITIKYNFFNNYRGISTTFL